MKYDLEERTTKFGMAVLILCKNVRRNIYNDNTVRQLIRSATSVGANYREANGASSKRDFKNKIHISKKEVNETKHWLKLLVTSNPEIMERVRPIYQECLELNMILQKIIFSLNNKK